MPYRVEQKWSKKTLVIFYTPYYQNTSPPDPLPIALPGHSAKVPGLPDPQAIHVHALR